MRKLVWDSSFRRALKGRTRNDRDLQERILDTLAELVADPFQAKLRTHKLKGASGWPVGLHGGIRLSNHFPVCAGS